MTDQTRAPADFGRERQRRIYLNGVAGKTPAVPVDPAALEKAARKAMTREAFAYVAGGAGMESTMAANRAALERWRIVPRMLRDVEVRDTSVELFGRRLPAPLLLAPLGVLEMAHPDADLAVAKAASSLGVPMIFSNQASVPMETCAAAMGSGPRWFQLYWSRQDALVRSLVARAEACGCEAIVLTLDTTMLGWRTRDLELAYLPFLRGKGIAQYTSDPTFLSSLATPLPDAPAESPRINLSSIRTAMQMVRRHPGRFVANLRSGVPRQSVQRFVATYSRPSLTWDHLDYLRGLTKLPIVLKGIQHADDARMAVERGMDGIVVSNHGGRQVDGAIGSLDALPAIADVVAGRIPVLFDSGIRGGADVFKALALGATAVLVGRPYAYGLAMAGEAGVREVVENLRADFDLTMGLAGCASIAHITRDNVVRI